MHRMKHMFTAGTLLGLVVLAGCTLTNTNTTNTATSEASDPALEDELFLDDEIEVIDEDVFGEDLTVVDRYPESVRSYYSSNEYETAVTFQTEADQDDVREFYLAALDGSEWQQEEIATDYMEFIRGDEDNPEILTIYFTPYEDEGVLEYELIYEPSLTDEQLDELEAEDESDLDDLDLEIE